MNDACYCDYDPPEFYHQERRKARTTHRCEECRKAILPGEQYEHVRGKWIGNVNSFDTCCRCLALRDFVVAHVPCSCWAHGNMIDDVMQDADAYWHEAPGLLFGAYRRQVLIQRGPAWEKA